MAGVRSLSPAALRWVRIAAGLVVVAAIAATVGAGPFLRGLLSVSPEAIVLAVVLIGLATAAAAWRWKVVAAGLGLELSWRGAVAAYYRSQFLNTVLPGGVVGDIHRAYRHGWRTGSVALAARAVATERIVGQIVQFALVAAVLASLGLASPLRGAAWAVAGIITLAAVALGVVATTRRGRRFVRRELGMLAEVFRDPARTVQIVASSLVVITSHATLFVVACLASGVRAPLGELVALALISLTAAAVPINVGGWGPREGAAASAFAVVGLGAAAGVAASTAFGVLATIAILPGAVVLLVDRVRRPSETPAIRPVTEEIHA